MFCKVQNQYLLGDGVPDGFAAPPCWVNDHIVISEHKFLGDGWVLHPVGYDAMTLRVQTLGGGGRGRN